MFDPTDLELLVEIEEAERLRDDHLRGVNAIIHEYVGQHYRGSREWASPPDAGDCSYPEPFSYSFVSNMLPALVFENPSVVVKARRAIGHRMVSEAMQSGIRGWIKDVNYKDELERAVLDSLFFQGILMHFIEDDTRWSDGAVRPAVRRVDYRTFGADSLADHIDHTKFMFHSYYVDTDDLASDPAVIPDSMLKLQNKSSSREADNAAQREPFKKGDAGTLKRKEVKVYSVWLRDKNVIRVICKDPRALPVYEPRPYYGPYCGPYTVFQAYPVPGQIYPLSPLVAVCDQVRDLQTHAKATGRSAAGRKTLVIVDGTSQTLPEDIKNGEDREVIAVQGFSSTQAMQIELGGVSNSQYEYLQFLRDRLDRHSGLTQTSRGTVGAADTATEASIAAEGMNNRLEFLKAKVTKSVSVSLHSIGWFLFNTPGIIIPVSSVDSLTGMESEGLFFGGPQDGVNVGDWNDYMLSIEPFSMQRVSEQSVQRRAMEFANYIASIAPLMPQMPWVRWLELLRSVGESMNVENVDRFLVPEMLQMFSQPDFQLTSQLMGGAQTPGDRYSIPGQGFKPKEGGYGASPVSDRLAEFGSTFGKIGGGTQGPPGSASPQGVMS